MLGTFAEMVLPRREEFVERFPACSQAPHMQKCSGRRRLDLPNEMSRDARTC